MPDTPAEAAAEIGPVCGNRRHHRPRARAGQQCGPDLLALLDQPTEADLMLAEVDRIPGDGGWRCDGGRDVYRGLAQRLAGHMPTADVLDVLMAAYAAAVDG
jgi:hypothetical protein